RLYERSEAASQPPRTTSARQIPQHLDYVLPRRNLRVVTQHATLLVHQARDPFRAVRRGIVGGAILDGEALVGVREERKGKRVLLREVRVPLWRVEARPEDGRVQLVEVVDSITESDAFGRSAGGIGPREEVEEHLLPAVVLERNPAAVMRGGREVGRAIAGLQH